MNSSAFDFCFRGTVLSNIEPFPNDVPISFASETAARSICKPLFEVGSRSSPLLLHDWRQIRNGHEALHNLVRNRRDHAAQMGAR